jgi:hypothetical protein
MEGVLDFDWHIEEDIFYVWKYLFLKKIQCVPSCFFKELEGNSNSLPAIFIFMLKVTESQAIISWNIKGNKKLSIIATKSLATIAS